MARRNTSISRNCLTCDMSFNALPCEIVKGKGKYCSTTCYHSRQRPTLKERFEQKIKRTASCWLWTAHTDRDGYGTFAVKDGRSVRAHKVAYELTHGPVPNGLWVLHRCDNPPCVNPSHLFLGTTQDNTADRVAKGRTSGTFKKGSRHANSILTEKDIREIRRLRASGMKRNAIARQFSIDPSSITKIVHRQQWAHVD